MLDTIGEVRNRVGALLAAPAGDPRQRVPGDRRYDTATGRR